MTYQPQWYPQLDGSAQEGVNCGAASGGMLADRARGGAKPATNYPWRTAIRPQGDGTGWVTPLPTMSSAIRKFCGGTAGLYARQIRDAIKAMYGVSTGYAFNVPWSTFVDFIVAGRGTIIAIDYSPLLGTKYAGSATFGGRHWFVVNQRRWNANLSRFEYQVFDPLADHRRSWVAQSPQWMPAPLLRRCFEATTSEVIYTV